MASNEDALAAAVAESIRSSARAIELAAVNQANQIAHEKLCGERQEVLLRGQDAAAAERIRLHEANQSSIRTIHSRMWGVMLLATAGSVGTIVTLIISMASQHTP